MTPAPLAGQYSVGAAMAATGRALDWYRDSILGDTISTEALLAEAAATPPGADGLLFLPYLAGERSPIWDPEARGVLAGLTLSHGRGHIARAILEASALAIRHVAAPMLAAGVEVREMRVCGGPAQSEAWNQIKADVTGFTVAVPHVLETAVLGSAILGACAIGAYPDLPNGDRGDDPRRSSTGAGSRQRRGLRPPVRGVRGALPGDRRRSCGRCPGARHDRPGRAGSGGRADEAAARSASPVSAWTSRLATASRSRRSMASTWRSTVARSSPSSARTAVASATLLRVIAGLLAPARGSAALDGDADHRPGRPCRARLPGAAPPAVAHERGQHHVPAGARRLVRGATGHTPRGTHRAGPPGPVCGHRATVRAVRRHAAARRAGPGPGPGARRSCCSTSRSARSMR